jgi:hypothetical protein
VTKRALKTPDLEVDVFMKTQKNIGYGSQWPRNSDIATIYDY